MSKSVHRTTVGFTDRSVRAIALAQETTGDSHVDVINRAVQVYAYLIWRTSPDHGDGAMVIQAKKPDGTVETIHLI